jgi:hypothetical protein
MGLGVRDVEAGGSNPLTPTNYFSLAPRPRPLDRDAPLPENMTARRRAALATLFPM